MSNYNDYEDEFLIIEDYYSDKEEEESLLIESSDYRDFVPSFTAVIIAHMLKLEFDSDHQTRSWINSIANSYQQIMTKTKGISRKKIIAAGMAKEDRIYKEARKIFKDDTKREFKDDIPDFLKVENILSLSKKEILYFIEINGTPDNIAYSKTLNYGI